MANNHKEKLEQAQKYVDSIKNQVALSKYRQGYHFMAPASWINDPMDLFSIKVSIIYFINIIHMIQNGDQCIGDMQKVRI